MKGSDKIGVIFVIAILMVAAVGSVLQSRIDNLKEQNQALRKSEHIKDSLYRNCNSKIIEHNKNVNMYESYLGSDANQ